MWFVRVWVPLAIAVTLLCVLLYVVTQQSYRQSFDDPQVRMAEDTAVLLRAGQQPGMLVPDYKIDIVNSLTPWFAIYSATGTPIASSGMMNGEMPQPPAGIFADLARATPTTTLAEIRSTWEPIEGMRQAIVVVSVDDRIVVAGRNMRDVEERMWNMQLVILFGWLVTMLATLVAVWLGSKAQDFISYARE